MKLSFLNKKKRKKKKQPNLFIIEIVRKYFPKLKKKLAKSRSKYNAEEYFKKGLLFSVQLSIVLTFILSIFIVRLGQYYYLIPLSFTVLFIFLFWFFLRMPDVISLKLKREIDRQLLYLVRHILISIDSGETLVNTLSKVAIPSYHTAGIMFEEIVDDIKVGTGIPESLQRAIDRSPSDNLTKILLEMQNSLKIGTDISTAMNRFIKELTGEGEINIKRYSKKMNSLTLFYLVVGVVVPSIGIAMATIMSSLINLQITFNDLLIVIFFLALLQAMFLSLYKNQRKSVIV
ncbi:MAG: type II secretion system F family protein [Nanoarchaeota archaeon]|nr:type II secretion system F family protein [Nanoarchaeota archaeon]